VESRRDRGRRRWRSAWVLFLFGGRSLLDSDTLGDELVGEYSDHGDLGTLGHGVVEKRWGSSVCDW